MSLLCMWPLTIYNVPATKVREMQNHITAKLKKWLGLPKSLSVECLYTSSGKLQLPFTELEEEMKAAKARLLTTLEEADDPCVRNAGIKVDGGRKADTHTGTHANIHTQRHTKPKTCS